MKTKPFAVILFLLIGYGCPSETNHADSKKCVLIYVDLTASIGEDGITTIKKHVYGIVSKLPAESRLVIRTIDYNVWGENLFDGQLPPQASRLPKDRNMFELKRNGMCNKIEGLIDERSKVIRGRSIQAKQLPSCIMDTFIESHEFFKGKQQYVPELIYMSDMFEQCSYSAGEIRIDMLNKKVNVEKVIRDIDQHFNPDDLDLKELVGNNLSFVVTSPDLSYANSKKLLSTKKLREVWKVAICKMGYSEEDFEQLHFATGLPERLLYPEKS